MKTLVISDARTFEQYRRNHPEKDCARLTQPYQCVGWNKGSVEVVDLSHFGMRFPCGFSDALYELKRRLSS